MNFYIIIISMFAFWYITNDHIDIRHDSVITAINDSGCASHQPPAPGYKQRIETYNLSSLKGNN